MKYRALVIAIATLGCGGGETAIVGLGNSGNRIVCDEIGQVVAEALAVHAATPRVSDDLIAEIFSSIVARAREGDPRAALIVLMLAKEQAGDGDES